MQISLLALIGIGLAAMFFGYGFGLFEGRGQGYKKRKQEEASDPTLRPIVQAPPPPSKPAVQAPPPDKGLLRLSLDANQQPCLDLDGQRVDTSKMEPQQRRRLIDLMVVMRPWIEGGPVARAPEAPAPQPAPVQAARPAAMPARPAAARTAAAARTTGPLEAAPAPTEPTSAPTSMIGQIDAILQAKLAGTPLASRGIRLVEAPGGAMVIVGLQRYPGVGDVPDPEVQALIREAIAEWEKKYTPS